jgi:hypothetical protein
MSSFYMLECYPENYEFVLVKKESGQWVTRDNRGKSHTLCSSFVPEEDDVILTRTKTDLIQEKWTEIL